jgi:hypothetical protein
VARPTVGGFVSVNQHRLRLEARVLGSDKRTNAQTRVLVSALEIMGEMLEEARAYDDAVKAGPYERPSNARPTATQHITRIEPFRSSRVMFIDGGRGSGKTSVMLTILQHLREQLLSGRRPVDDADVPDLAPGVVIPLGMIDLATLPASTSIIMQIGVQLSRRISALTDGPRGTDDPFGLETEEPEARRLWRAWAGAVGAAWDGTLSARRDRLDPLDYAQEIEDGERRRASVDDLSFELIDAMAKAHTQTQSLRRREPLFLIPIDDADMSPSRTYELLSILRLLWHPRLAFLITGNMTLLEVTVHRELAELLKSAELPNELRRLPSEILAKTLAPSLRLHLPALTLSERRQFLEPWLSEPVNAVMDILPMTEEALPSTMRAVADLRLALGMPRENEHSFHRELVVDLWKRAVEDDPPTGGNRPELAELVTLRKAPSGGPPEFEVHIPLSRVAIGWSKDTLYFFAAPVPPGPFRASQLLSGLGWIEHPSIEVGVRLPSASAVETQTLARLSGRARAAFVLATTALERRAGDIGTAAALEGTVRLRWVVWRGIVLDNIEVTLPLPAPPYRTIAESAALVQLWQIEFEQMAEHGITDMADDEPLRRYMRAALDVISAGSSVPSGRVAVGLRNAIESARGRNADDVPDWLTLRERVTRLRKLTAVRLDLETWLDRDVWVLAAPEFGLDTQAANEWLFGAGGVPETRDSLADRGARLRAARSMLWRESDRTMDLLETDLLRIDQRFPEHPWSKWVSQVTTTPAARSRVDTLRQRLRSFPVGPLRDVLGRQHRSLEDYLTDWRATRLGQEAEPTLALLEEQALRLSQEGAPPQWVLRVLYTTAVEQRESPPGAWTVRYRADRIEVRTEPGDTAKYPITEEIMLSPSTGRQVLLRKLGMPEIELPPAEDILYRISWDYRSDLYEETPLEAFLWEGLVAGPSRRRWPFPGWHAFIDLESPIECWTREIARVAGLAYAQTDATTMQNWIDGMFLIHIRNVCAQFERGLGSSGMRVPDNLSERDADQTVDILHSILGRTADNTGKGGAASPRTAAFVEWANLVPGFADPEYGVSERMSQWVRGRLKSSKEAVGIARRQLEELHGSE